MNTRSENHDKKISIESLLVMTLVLCLVVSCSKVRYHCKRDVTWDNL